MDFDIRLIQVDGEYKALVIDLNKETNRLAYISEDQDKNVAYNRAIDFILSQGASIERVEQCH